MLRFITILALLLVSSACTNKSYKPVTHQDSIVGRDADELELFRRADDIHNELEKKGYIIKDSQTQEYINVLTSKIVPDSAKEKMPIQVYAVKDAQINAFALPNGHIYLHSGLLSRLENESQLAFLIGHEAAHITHRHSLNRFQSNKQKIAFANIIAVAPYGGFVSLGTLSTVLHHSRSDESQADQLGLQYAIEAGYDVHNFAGLFERLKIGKRPRNTSSIWSTHPSLEQRKKFIANYIKQHNPPNGVVDSQRFKGFRNYITRENINSQITRKQYLLALENIEQELNFSGTTQKAELYFQKGEIYRDMAKHPVRVAKQYALLEDKKHNKELEEEFKGKTDQYWQESKKAYQQALKFKKNYAKAYRGLGLIAYHYEHYRQAKSYLKKYLSLENNTKDKRYINHLIEEINQYV